ncbi:hypothetical protein EPO04_02920 [Patescibacteria group bacterium]|nr:MAG: hypothetical protein EPO04_02920 [Patescibacteria group bacterium]
MFKRFGLISILAALLGLTGSCLASQAVASSCSVAGKTYQSWTVYAKDRKVGDPATKKVSSRGDKGVVSIKAPPLPSLSGKFRVDVTPKPGCAVTKVRVRTRRGVYRLVRIKTSGGTISFRAKKGSRFPYREVRVWSRKAAKSSANSGSQSGGVGSSCDNPYKASFTGTDDRYGNLSQIRLSLEQRDTPSNVRFSWALLNGNVLCKYRIYVDGMNSVQATYVDSSGGYYDYVLNGPVRFNQLVVWARRP